jgi:hypothetical protein
MGTVVMVVVIDCVVVRVFEIGRDCFEQDDEWLADGIWDEHGLLLIVTWWAGFGGMVSNEA